MAFIGCKKNDNGNYDLRNKYIGEYKFNVTTTSYIYYIGSPIGMKYADTSYQYIGVVEKYLDNRLMIKYSDLPLYVRCVSSGCIAGLNSNCIINCPEPQRIYFHNWINPVLYENDSIQLYKSNSWMEGCNGKFFNNDSLHFRNYYHESIWGFDDIISGIKLN
jgi:hypothetical protein